MSSRGYPITQQRRAERRKQAGERQAEYDKLTLQQKLDKLPVGGAKKERARLEMQVMKLQARVTQTSAPDNQAAANKQNNNQNKEGK